jgi:hypothetical protein
MLFSSNACRFALFSLSLLSANAETVRGADRELAIFEPTVVLEPPVSLGDAANYVILAKSGISTVPDSVITGDIAVSPIAATAMTGFDFTLDSSTATFATSTQVIGKAYAATYATPIPTHLTTAVGFMEAAYTDAKGRPNEDSSRKDLGAGTLGGEYGGPEAELTPGVYTFSSDVGLASDIYFKGSGVFIMQIAGNLLQDGDVTVILEEGATAENIFWQVAGHVEVGLDAHMEGILLVKTAVRFVTGSSLKGRVLTQKRCDLQKATITETS